MKSIIGKKLGMTQVFDEKGNVVPVTVIEAGPCPVGDIRVKKVNKPMAGHFAKNGVAPKRTLKEFDIPQADIKVGDVLKASIFESGEKVDVVGTSKGKGTAGVIKRWNFSRIKETHGSGPVHRHAGSLGACSTPSKVMKGKKMAGRLGHERVTIQNLTVIKVDDDNNLLAIKGAVPGPKGGIVLISTAVKA
jgi:large subunit ribosomal protein L3